MATEIGIIDHHTVISPATITAAEYLRDGASNDWMAPVDLTEWFQSTNGYYSRMERVEICQTLAAAGRCDCYDERGQMVTILAL